MFDKELAESERKWLHIAAVFSCNFANVCNAMAAQALANKGWKKACKDNPALALGLNIVEGKIVYKAVADVFGLKYEPVSL